MDHKLRALVRVDLSCSSLTIRVTGCFTILNYRALVPVIRRARALPTQPAVAVDVTRARHLEPEAVLLLEEACRSLLSDNQPEAVKVIAPSFEGQAVETSNAHATKAASTSNPAAGSAADAWMLAS